MKSMAREIFKFFRNEYVKLKHGKVGSSCNMVNYSLEETQYYYFFGGCHPSLVISFWL